MLTLTIRKQRRGPVLNRHPWLFSRGLEHIPEGLKAGTPVELRSEDGTYLAGGYFNSYSQIAVRLWSFREHEEVNKDFFKLRIRNAHEARKRYIEGPETDSYRLVNGESDLLPGLIVDKYGDCLAVQFHTRGIEHWKELILDALVETVRPAGIYERSEAVSREVEGMESRSGLLYGNIPDLVTITENGYRFLVDVKLGQKTGFFLDQRDKRRAVLRYSDGRSALNCFSYTGGFSVYALAGGAQRVVSVDTSSPALELAKQNIRLNGLDISRCDFVCDDAKKYLRNARPQEHDLIILDPPAFIKDRRKIQEGLAGYRGINESALGLLPDNGILVTCSCSAHVSLQDFRYLLTEAGGKAKRSVRVLETFTHGIDHAVLAPFTEGEYLKCFFTMV